MNESEKIYAATYAVGKNLDYEKLMYCDLMYGKEDQTEGVWDYVQELGEIGSIAFKDKYKEHKMYYMI